MVILTPSPVVRMPKNTRLAASPTRDTMLTPSAHVTMAGAAPSATTVLVMEMRWGPGAGGGKPPEGQGGREANIQRAPDGCWGGGSYAYRTQRRALGWTCSAPHGPRSHTFLA